jgi:hypothetical protein
MEFHLNISSMTKLNIYFFEYSRGVKLAGAQTYFIAVLPRHCIDFSKLRFGHGGDIATQSNLSYAERWKAIANAIHSLNTSSSLRKIVLR